MSSDVPYWRPPTPRGQYGRSVGYLWSRSPFVGTNPMDEPINSHLPVIRPESHIWFCRRPSQKPILGARGRPHLSAQRVIVGLNPEYAVQNGATIIITATHGTRSRDKTRHLRNPVTVRRGWHGRGVPRHRHETRPRCGTEAACPRSTRQG